MAPRRLELAHSMNTRNRFIGLGAVITASGILSIITANECHSTFVAVQRDVSYTPSLLFGVAMWGWWALVTVCLWTFSEHDPRVLAFQGKAFLGHTFAAVGLGVLHLFFLQWLLRFSGHLWPAWGLPYENVNYQSVKRLGIELVIYGFIYGVSGFLHTHRQKRREAFGRLELESQLTQAQLKALQMQMEPHFLFNTLNTITSFVTQGRNQEANRTLAHLNTILRTTLQRRTPEKVPFTEELRVVESYLAIQQARFVDRLSVKIDASEDAKRCLVPSFILQPLVENAVQHGIASSEAGGTIETLAKRVGDDLWLQVRDDGVGSNCPPSSGYGIGITNTRERLAFFYPGTHTLTAGPLSSGGYEVTICIPYEQVATA